MKAKDFVHLHNHSEYSLLDGLTKIKNMVKLVKDLGMESIALTDHGALYGAIEFYKKCRETGIKPIIGCEMYLSPNNRKDKTPSNRQNYHLILLAKDILGYKNLMKMVSIAHLEGFYYKPRIDWEILEKYHAGIICTSACIEGELANHLLENNYKKAKEKAADYQSLFGSDFYIEIQDHPKMSAQKNANRELVKLSRELGIPLVATNDSHYLRKEDAFAQDVLLMINTQTTINTLKRLSMMENGSDFYIKSPQEMEQAFRDYPDAIKNTKEIAEKCHLKIELGKWYFPKINLPKNKTAEETLTEITLAAAKDHYNKNFNNDVSSRLEYELEIICSKGYAPYFLIMRDFIKWTEENDTITNTRGSAAGSLVSFVLGITSVDPLIYKIPFERFLNKDRPSPPDIDLDVSDNKRQNMLYHIIDEYGEEAVAQICTFNRMMARGSIRDTARVLGYEYAVGDRISKLIPVGSQGFPMSIERALKISPELQSLYETDTDAKKIIETAEQIEGSARNVSVHACALVISPTTINDFSPTQQEPGGNKEITQYEMHAVEDVGLVKLDILGIRNLSILGNAVVNVRKEKGIDINLRKIPLDDKKTFDMLSAGRTMGVFQLGGEGMTKWVMELKPNRVEDLMVMVALYRPGPMAVIPEYIARKKDPTKITYPDPKMKEFLEASYGLLVYQDDCLYTAINLAGYSWVEADKFRKAIGKKIPEEMEKQKNSFINGCIKNGLPKQKAVEIFKLIEPFVGYGFNKAHAASYGMLAYHTAYMKANYPVEYMCALLTAEAEDVDKVSAGIEECRKMGIIVQPPDINRSENDFTLEKNTDSLDKIAIRFGLNAIKNVGNAAVEEIFKTREEGGEFSSLTDFCLRVSNRKINKKVFESLIKAGAMDRFGKRSAMMSSLDVIREKCEKQLKEASNGQTNLFGNQEEVQKMNGDDLVDIEEFPKEQILKYEKELLGLYLQEHPVREKLKRFEEIISHKIHQILEMEEGNVKTIGIVSSLRVITTKNGGKQMAFVSLEDETGKIEVVVFPTIFNKSQKLLTQEGIIFIEAKIDQRDEKKSLIAEKIINPQETNITTMITEEMFFIEIPKGTKPQVLVKINGLLKKNPGTRQGIIRFPNGKEVRLLFRVNWTAEMENEIKKLLTPA